MYPLLLCSGSSISGCSFSILSLGGVFGGTQQEIPRTGIGVALCGRHRRSEGERRAGLWVVTIMVQEVRVDAELMLERAAVYWVT